MNLRLLILTKIITICLFFTSCKKSLENEILVVPVSEEFASSFNYSEIVKEIEYIKLEDNNKAIVTQIDKILFSESKIYLLQRFFNPRIMVFDLNGAYLYDIGNQGGGPSEFEYPYDLLINESDELEVLANNAIKRYSSSNGEFINTIKLNLPAVRFIKKENSYIFLCGGDSDEVVFTDFNFKTEASFFKKGPQNEIDPMVSFHPLKNEVFFHMNFNDTIYNIDKDNNIYPSKVVSFPKPLTGARLEELYSISNEDIRKVKKLSAQYMTYIQIYNETQDHIYFTFMYEGKPFVHIYNKKSTDGITFDPSKVVNDVTFESLAPYIFDTSSDGYQVGYMEAPVKSLVLQNSEFSSNPYFQNLKTKFNEANSTIDNPVIFKLKLK